MLCYRELKSLYGLKHGGDRKGEDFKRSTERLMTEDEIAKEVTSQKLRKKLGVNDHKNPTVSRRYCAECDFAITHETGSLIWIECKLQNNGWRDINSECNIPDTEFQGLAKKVGLATKKLALCILAEAALLYLFYLSGDLTLETVCYLFLGGFFIPRISEDYLAPVFGKLLKKRSQLK